jgi:hypothetical protein
MLIKPKIEQSLAYEAFDKYLDENYPITVIGEYEYRTSAAFKKVSPLTYEEDFQEFLKQNNVELE